MVNMIVAAVITAQALCLTILCTACSRSLFSGISGGDDAADREADEFIREISGPAANLASTFRSRAQAVRKPGSDARAALGPGRHAAPESGEPDEVDDLIARWQAEHAETVTRQQGGVIFAGPDGTEHNKPDRPEPATGSPAAFPATIGHDMSRFLASPVRLSAITLTAILAASIALSARQSAPRSRPVVPLTLAARTDQPAVDIISVHRARAAQLARISRAHAARSRRHLVQVQHQVPAPVYPAPLPSGDGILSAAQIGALWISRGGSPSAEQVAVCVAEHESGGNTQIVSPTDDWGLYQIHAGGPAMLNAAANTSRAIAMSADGTNWSAWTTAASCGAPMAVRARLLVAHVLRRISVYDWALTQRGCPYVWAGAGPCRNGYDCSGLVMAAWQRAGVSLPHNTQAMIDSGKLIRTWHPRRGDIVMFFSGGYAVHAGIVVYKDRWMLDAPEPGAVVHEERIEDWSGVWHAFYRLR